MSDSLFGIETKALATIEAKAIRAARGIAVTRRLQRVKSSLQKEQRDNEILLKPEDSFRTKDINWNFLLSSKEEN